MEPRTGIGHLGLSPVNAAANPRGAHTECSFSASVRYVARWGVKLAQTASVTTACGRIGIVLQ